MPESFDKKIYLYFLIAVTIAALFIGIFIYVVILYGYGRMPPLAC